MNSNSKANETSERVLRLRYRKHGIVKGSFAIEATVSFFFLSIQDYDLLG